MKIFIERSQIVCLSVMIGTLALLPSVTLNAGDLFADARPSPLNPFASRARDTQSSSEVSAVSNPFRNAASGPTRAVQHISPNAASRSPRTLVQASSNFGNVTSSSQVGRQPLASDQTGKVSEPVQLASASEPVSSQDQPVSAVAEEGDDAPNQSLVRQCFTTAVPLLASKVETTREPTSLSTCPEPQSVQHSVEASGIVVADYNNSQLVNNPISTHDQIAHEALINEVSDATQSTVPFEEITISDSAANRDGTSDLRTASTAEFPLEQEAHDSAEHHPDLTVSDLQQVANAEHRNLTEEPVASDVANTGQSLPFASAVENSSPVNRQRIIFRPGVPSRDSHGRIVLQPKLSVAGGDGLPLSFPSSSLPTLSTTSSQELMPPSVVEPATILLDNDHSNSYLKQLPSSNERTSAVAQSQAPKDPMRSVHKAAPPAHSRGMAELPPPQMPVEDLPIENNLPQYNNQPVTEMPANEGNEISQVPYAPTALSCAAPVGMSDDDLSPVAKIWNRLIDRLQGPPCYQGALGVERVMYAPFFIENTQPLQNCRVRFDFAWNEQAPDRLEYFWAKTPFGLGPPPPGFDPKADPQPAQAAEPSVDYQDIRFYIERGSPKFSVATELPIRLVDPEIRDATAGFADMNLTTKAVLLDGRRWKLSQTFRTYFPTGSALHGTGDGHFSLEPGVAYQYKFSDVTYLHGDLKYWFPLGANPYYTGQILNYGLGISHVAVDRDNFAVIPTFEAIAWSIPDGAQTPPGEIDDGFRGERIAGMNIVNLCPGVRFAWDNGRDCGVREVGISSGIAVTENHWYENILRIELRWSY